MSTALLDQPSSLEVVSDMQLSTPDVLGVCAMGVGTAVRFLVDVPLTSCWIGPVDLAAACQSSLNYSSTHAWMIRKMHSLQLTKQRDFWFVPNFVL